MFLPFSFAAADLIELRIQNGKVNAGRAARKSALSLDNSKTSWHIYMDSG